MEITGNIISRQGSVVTINVRDTDRLAELDKNSSGVVSLLFDDERSVSVKQRNFAFGIIRDIANASIGGSDADYEQKIYDHFKSDMAKFYGVENFSLSHGKGNMSDANLLISLLLEFCLYHNVPLSYRPLDVLADPYIKKFEYRCLLKKMCVICGHKADHHHITGSKVGMGNDRTKINHKGRRLIALCREHHDLFHHEEKERMAKYHLQGVPVDEKIAQIYNLNYW